MILLAALAVAVIGNMPCRAQSLSDLLNKATDVVQGITGKSNVELTGTWTFSGSCIEFESDNLLQKAGGSVASSAVEKKLDGYLSKAGIKPGNMQFTFAQDSTFTVKVSGKEKKGTYSYDAENKKMTLKFSKLFTTNPQVKCTSSELDLLFDADKLLKLITYISSKSGNSTLQSLSTLAGSYDGMLLGLAFKKE